MQTLNERIQLEVLGRLAGKPYAVVNRKDMAALFNVTDKRVDNALALCSLVARKVLCRQRASGGKCITYQLAE